MQHSKLVAILLTASLLSACTEPNGEPGRGIENGGALSKEDVGIAVGAVGGGVAGAFIGAGWGQVAAIGGGALLGGLLGHAIGKSMDNADRAAYDRASQRAMETGETTEWRNDKSGHYGTIMPDKQYRNNKGQHCRKYTQRIYIDGKKHEGYGTACRGSDGTWKIVN